MDSSKFVQTTKSKHDLRGVEKYLFWCESFATAYPVLLKIMAVNVRHYIIQIRWSFKNGIYVYQEWVINLLKYSLL